MKNAFENMHINILKKIADSWPKIRVLQCKWCCLWSVPSICNQNYSENFQCAVLFFSNYVLLTIEMQFYNLEFFLYYCNIIYQTVPRQYCFHLLSTWCCQFFRCLPWKAIFTLQTWLSNWVLDGTENFEAHLRTREKIYLAV